MILSRIWWPDNLTLEVYTTVMLLMLQLLTGKNYAIYACTETSVCSFVALHCIVGYTISDMKCSIAWHMLVTLQASTFFVHTLRKREYNTVLIYLSWNYSYVHSKQVNIWSAFMDVWIFSFHRQPIRKQKMN